MRPGSIHDQVLLWMLFLLSVQLLPSGGENGKQKNLSEDLGWTPVDNSGRHPKSECRCWSNSYGNSNYQVDCRCRGEEIQEIPANLSTMVTRLTIANARIEVLRSTSLQPYRTTLREVILIKLPNLRGIEPGAFDNLAELRTIYVYQAPALKTLEAQVFQVNLPKFKSLRIVHTGLEKIPDVRDLVTDSILHIVDLDNNEITKIPTSAIKIKALELLSINYNKIRTVESHAFNGTQLGRLSLKGNRLLTNLHPEAFAGIRSLRELDLSQTSITQLPTRGLQDLEYLRIQNTETLKVFPSIYSFQHIKEAWLTYSYHCCAFRFPAMHDPKEHERYQQFKSSIEKNCSQVVAATTFTKLTKRRRSTDGIWEQDYKWIHNEDHVEETTPNPKGNSPRQQVFHGPGQPGKFNQILHSPKDATTSHKNSYEAAESGHEQKSSDFGEFHATHIALNSTVLEAQCGTISKNYRDVMCYPIPDAFNPCEDIMGTSWLRVAVWFVVVAAVVGNLLVMVVLASSRFRMTVPKFLMCNLAFADFCMGIYLFIIAAMDLHSIGVYFNHAIDWQIGPGCQVAGFLTVFASELSIFTLTVITIERWYTITYAIHLNKRLTLGAAVKIMLLGWTYALTMATLPLLGISGYTKTSICLPMENEDMADVAYLITLLIFNGIAFIIICACYGKMYFSISGHNAAATHSDMTVAKKMALLVFTDFACWAPIAFFGLTAVAGYPLIDVTDSKILLVFFYPLNSCANPYLYAILTKQYRRDLFVILSKYGFCSQRATVYKGACSGGNTVPRVGNSNSGPNHRNSMLTQVTLSSVDSSRHWKRKSSSGIELTPHNTPPTPTTTVHTSAEELSRKSMLRSPPLGIIPEASKQTGKDQEHNLPENSTHTMRATSTKLCQSTDCINKKDHDLVQRKTNSTFSSPSLELLPLRPHSSNPVIKTILNTKTSSCENLLHA